MKTIDPRATIGVRDTSVMSKKFGFSHSKILIIANRLLEFSNNLDSDIVENIYKESATRKYIKYDLTPRGYLIILFETTSTDSIIHERLSTEKQKHINSYLNTIAERDNLISDKALLVQEIEALKSIPLKDNQTQDNQSPNLLF